MRPYFDCEAIGRVPALGLLMLISLAVGPIELSAQGPAPKPPGEVLRAFRKLDSEGGLLDRKSVV